MTIDRSGPAKRSSATRVLPWLVGAGALLVYLVTLNHWISLLSLGTVSRVSGWNWRPELGQPLTFVVLYPFRWLPEPAIPLALNLFTVACAALVLVLLARSVALLPHDLTPEDRLRPDRPVTILSTPTAWMPPVLAAILCGLQLSFWEHATSASGEMIDLLVFAYVIRCLLEYRIDRDPAWLFRCVCVYGAGMANNWAMVGYFPVFCVAILRTTGFGLFLNRRLLLRLAIWGLAGLSLYLLLPVLGSLSPDGQVDFWGALKVHLKFQKGALVGLRSPAMRVLALTWLLPLIVLSIRWKSHTVQLGDDTPLGVFLTKATGHVVHGLFFVMSGWIALDPSFSPRHLGRGTPMLSYYYLSALVFGYCAGYFLLFGAGGVPRRYAKLPRVAGGVLICVLPLVLLWRNSGQMVATNGLAVREFARQLFADLPPGQCVVLSEEIGQLLLLRAELGVHAQEKDPLLVDTASLPLAEYHRFMANRFKSRWPEDPPTNRVGVVGAVKQVELVSAFAAHEPVVYLHPSSGLFLESFTDEPNGAIHCLKPVRAAEVRPGLAAAIVATNEQLWQQRWTNGLKSLVTYTRAERRYSGWAGSLMSSLRLTPERNRTALVLGAVYSKSLNYWGVTMQRLGSWAEAGMWFRRALELNPDNLSAQINALYNERWQRGEKTRLDGVTVEHQFRDLFARYNNWAEVLGADGPVDEPTFLFRTARILLPGRNYRQAAMWFARCAELAPEWVPPKLRLAESYLGLRNFSKALEVTDAIQTSGRQLGGPGLADLLFSRVTALRELGRTNEATACIESFVGRCREHGEVLATAANLYAASGQLVQALDLVDELLKRDPNHLGLLMNKGFVQLRLLRYDAAIATLTKVLSLAPSDGEARLRRAVAFLEAGQLDAARDDYEQLLKTTNQSQNALFGLGAIAWRKGDTNVAMEVYRQFLSNAVPRSLQHKIASDRLKQLNEGAPEPGRPASAASENGM